MSIPVLKRPAGGEAGISPLDVVGLIGPPSSDFDTDSVIDRMKTELQ